MRRKALLDWALSLKSVGSISPPKTNSKFFLHIASKLPFLEFEHLRRRSCEQKKSKQDVE